MGLFKLLFSQKNKEKEKDNFVFEVEEIKQNVSGWINSGYIGSYDNYKHPSFGISIFINKEYIGNYLAGEIYQRSMKDAIDYLNNKLKPLISNCRYCNISKEYPIEFTKIKHIIIYRDVPDYNIIAHGWRVSKVKCVYGEEDVLFASGDHGLYIKINWKFKLGEICNKCAHKLRELVLLRQIGLLFKGL